MRANENTYHRKKYGGGGVLREKGDDEGKRTIQIYQQIFNNNLRIKSYHKVCVGFYGLAYFVFDVSLKLGIDQKCTFDGLVSE